MVMDRRTFISGVAFGLVSVPQALYAQPTGSVRKIGYLHSGSNSVSPHFVEAFRQGMREFGWVEGRNIIVDYRFAEGKFDRLPDLVEELVRLKVEVIVAGSAPPALAAKKATATIPIVIWGVSDPVAIGLVASLARPGGNVTGVSLSVGTDLYGKELQLLKEAVPKIQRVAILSNAANPAHEPAVSSVKAAAGSLGVSLQLLEVRARSEFDSAFEAMVKERAEGLLVVADSMFTVNRARLADLAAANRLPSMFGLREYVEAGGLMSYGPSIPHQLRQAAVYVDKILKGAKPADLPVEQPTKFELVINLKTAKALGLTILPSLLRRADEVIQ
jgi:putative ABC transport system substrate-binding protein